MDGRALTASELARPAGPNVRSWLFATESAHPSFFCSTPNMRHTGSDVGFSLI